MVEQTPNKQGFQPGNTIGNRWEEGESGNPKGRPPNTNSITYWYKKLLAEKDGVTAQEIAKMAIERAKQGSLPHTQEITDRTDGTLAKQVPIDSRRDIQNVLVFVLPDGTRVLPGGFKQMELGEPEVNEGEGIDDAE